jgi:hypothetical protein
MRKIKREEKHPGRELFGSLPRTQMIRHFPHTENGAQKIIPIEIYPTVGLWSIVV